jgi:hypothetical protein
LCGIFLLLSYFIKKHKRIPLPLALLVKLAAVCGFIALIVWPVTYKLRKSPFFPNFFDDKSAMRWFGCHLAGTVASIVGAVVAIFTSGTTHGK